MTELVDAYQRDDIRMYESVLHRSGSDLLNDSFIAENIDEVTRNMRTKGVVKLIAPYTRVRLSWIAGRLRVTDPEVQDIVGFLIVDGRIQGRIDEQQGILEINAVPDSNHSGEPSGGSSTSIPDEDRVEALGSLDRATGSLFRAIFRDADGFRPSPVESAIQGGFLDQLGDIGPPGDFRADRLAGLGSRRSGRRGKAGFLSSMVH